MNTKVNVNSETKLNPIIKSIQLGGQTVEILDHEKVVAKIVPFSSNLSEYSSNYKTWGETLKNY